MSLNANTYKFIKFNQVRNLTLCEKKQLFASADEYIKEVNSLSRAEYPKIQAQLKKFNNVSFLCPTLKTHANLVAKNNVRSILLSRLRSKKYITPSIKNQQHHDRVTIMQAEISELRFNYKKLLRAYNEQNETLCGLIRTGESSLIKKVNVAALKQATTNFEPKTPDNIIATALTKAQKKRLRRKNARKNRMTSKKQEKILKTDLFKLGQEIYACDLENKNLLKDFVSQLNNVPGDAFVGYYADNTEITPAYHPNKGGLDHMTPVKLVGTL